MQQAITDRDYHIQAIQYENIVHLGEIKNARQTVEDLIENRQIDMTICSVCSKKIT